MLGRPADDKVGSVTNPLVGHASRRSLRQSSEGMNNTAQTQISHLTIERDSLSARLESLTTEATKAKTDLTAAKSQVEALTAQLKAARSVVAAGGKNVGRLEAILGLGGVDPSNAVPADVDGSRGHILDEWMGEKDPKAKAMLFREHKTAIRAEVARRQAASDF